MDNTAIRERFIPPEPEREPLPTDARVADRKAGG